MKIHTKINNIIIITSSILLMIFLVAPVTFAEYETGFEWRKLTDYTEGTVSNSTMGNPNPDQLGNPVWSYEWYTITSENFNGRNMMYWNDWRWVNTGGAVNISKWDQNVHLDSNWNPGITSLVRWTNPTDESITVDMTGRLRTYWGGLNWVNGGWSNYFVAAPADVRVILGYYDSSEGSTELLIDNIYSSPISAETVCNTFGECPHIDTPLDRALSVDAGDSLFWTTIPLDYVPGKNRWITTNDGPVILTLSGTMDYNSTIIPEPVSSMLFLSGSAIFGIRRYLKHRS